MHKIKIRVPKYEPYEWEVGEYIIFTDHRDSLDGGVQEIEGKVLSVEGREVIIGFDRYPCFTYNEVRIRKPKWYSMERIY